MGKAGTRVVVDGGRGDAGSIEGYVCIFKEAGCASQEEEEGVASTIAKFCLFSLFSIRE